MGRPARFKGRCHCGAIAFEVELDPGHRVTSCNCSLCVRRGALTAVVKPEAFEQLWGENGLQDYKPGLGTYSFCKTCGIHVFGRGDIAHLGGPFVAVNLNCLDAYDRSRATILHVDGRNDTWEVLRIESPTSGDAARYGPA